jgi:Mitochondrial carrier protein
MRGIDFGHCMHVCALHCLTLCNAVSYTVSYLCIQDLPFAATLVASAAAGGAASFVTNPLDMAKVSDQQSMNHLIPIVLAVLIYLLHSHVSSVISAYRMYPLHGLSLSAL